MASWEDIGCGKPVSLEKRYGNNVTKCGVANAWGEEKFCENCKNLERALRRKKDDN